MYRRFLRALLDVSGETLQDIRFRDPANAEHLRHFPPEVRGLWEVSMGCTLRRWTGALPEGGPSSVTASRCERGGWASSGTLRAEALAKRLRSHLSRAVSRDSSLPLVLCLFCPLCFSLHLYIRLLPSFESECSSRRGKSERVLLRLHCEPEHGPSGEGGVDTAFTGSCGVLHAIGAVEAGTGGDVSCVRAVKGHPSQVEAFRAPASIRRGMRFVRGIGLGA